MIDFDGVSSIADFARQQARVRPDAAAMWFEGRTTTFDALNKRSNQIANALIAAGIEPGDRIAYLGKNMDAYYDILIGGMKAR
ncbi:MAG: AMP-binding protein, partial [Pseudomonadota bacterium]